MPAHSIQVVLIAALVCAVCVLAASIRLRDSGLAIGGFFAYLSINSETFQQFFKQIKKYQIALVYVLGLSTLMYGNFIYPNKYDIVYMRIISTTFFAFIITEQNFSEHSIYKLGKIKFVTQLGKYTYGLYLIHPIGIQAVAIILYKILKFPIDIEQNI